MSKKVPTTLHRVFSYTLITLLLGLFLLNLIAWRQADAMMTFADAGQRTKSPEALSLLEKIQLVFTGIHIPKTKNYLTPAHVELTYKTHLLTSIHGIQLEIWQIPHPAPTGIVVIGHGYSAAKQDSLLEASIFHELGYEVVMLDFRGHGGSTGRRTSLGWYEANDLMAVVTFIRESTPNLPLILYGHSMGGAAILRAIAELGLKPDAIIIEAVFGTMLQAVSNRFHAMGLPAFPSAHLLTFWGGVQQDLNSLAHAPIRYARHVSCPTLVMQGALDQRVTLAEAASIATNLPVANKQLLIFEQSSHSNIATTEPDKWAIAVAQFTAQTLQPVMD
ncbi:MAG: alpha/beta hydrolase [Pseudomonadota bacterium]